MAAAAVVPADGLRKGASARLVVGTLGWPLISLDVASCCCCCLSELMSEDLLNLLPPE